jgi:hypothetical protein
MRQAGRMDGWMDGWTDTTVHYGFILCTLFKEAIKSTSVHCVSYCPVFPYIVKY